MARGRWIGGRPAFGGGRLFDRGFCASSIIIQRRAGVGVRRHARRRSICSSCAAAAPPRSMRCAAMARLPRACWQQGRHHVVQLSLLRLRMLSADCSARASSTTCGLCRPTEIVTVEMRRSSMREFIYTGGPPRKAWRPKAKVWRFLSFWPSLSHAQQLNIPSWPRSVVGRYAILRALHCRLVERTESIRIVPWLEGSLSTFRKEFCNELSRRF